MRISATGNNTKLACIAQKYISSYVASTKSSSSSCWSTVTLYTATRSFYYGTLHTTSNFLDYSSVVRSSSISGTNVYSSYIYNSYMTPYMTGTLLTRQVTVTNSTPWFNILGGRLYNNQTFTGPILTKSLNSKNENVYYTIPLAMGIATSIIGNGTQTNQSLMMIDLYSSTIKISRANSYTSAAFSVTVSSSRKVSHRNSAYPFVICYNDYNTIATREYQNYSYMTSSVSSSTLTNNVNL